MSFDFYDNSYKKTIVWTQPMHDYQSEWYKNAIIDYNSCTDSSR